MYKSTVIIIRCTLYTLVSKLLYRHITYSNVQGCQTTVKEGEKLGGHQKYDWLARDCLLLLGEFREIYLPLNCKEDDDSFENTHQLLAKQ